MVLCYTGDRLNFGAAVEAIRVETGMDARMVIVSDDVALRVKGASARKTSARGLAGTMLVLKVAGAAAAAGRSLDDVEALATWVASNVTTMGVSLTSCSIPGRSKESQRRLDEEEMEYGLGAHAEPGAKKTPVHDLDTIVRTVVERVGCVGAYEDDQKVEAGSQVVVLINNMGGTTLLEQGAIVGSVRRQVEEVLGCRVVRLLAGHFLTSLDMKGFSVSLLRLTDDKADEILRFLDAPTDAMAWPAQRPQPVAPSSNVVSVLQSRLSSKLSFRTTSITPDNVDAVCPAQLLKSIHEAIARGCNAAIAAKDVLNELDGAIGDGDCGSTFARGGRLVLESDRVKSATSLHEALAAIADVAGEAMGGSSGVLLKILFSSMAAELQNCGTADPSRAEIARGLAAGVDKMMLYGGAVQGDSTMLDALIPFSRVLNGGGTWEAALTAAEKGAEETKAMTASAGRASYVPEKTQEGVADPGATAVVEILRGVFLPIR